MSFIIPCSWCLCCNFAVFQLRVLTLQVIGELILTLSPEESEQVFPDLYLPIVEEANRRVWAPWRKYMFWAPSQRQYKYVYPRQRLSSRLYRYLWVTISKIMPQ